MGRGSGSSFSSPWGGSGGEKKKSMWTASSSILWQPSSAIPISNFPLTAAVHSDKRRHLSAQLGSGAGDATPLQAKHNKGEVGDGRELSGSDVLWALQRAASQKKKRMSGNKKKKKRGSSPADGRREGLPDDSSAYSNVQPLSIQGDWATRLDELERRLHELSDIY